MHQALRLLVLSALLAPAPALFAATQRVVAVGDVHGEYEGFVSILRKAGLIDQKLAWTGGRTTLVQTGDFLDRGPDVRKVMDLLMSLERGAAKRARPDDRAPRKSRRDESHRISARRESRVVRGIRGSPVGEAAAGRVQAVCGPAREAHPAIRTRAVASAQRDRMERTSPARVHRIPGRPEPQRTVRTVDAGAKPSRQRWTIPSSFTAGSARTPGSGRSRGSITRSAWRLKPSIAYASTWSRRSSSCRSSPSRRSRWWPPSSWRAMGGCPRTCSGSSMRSPRSSSGRSTTRKGRSGSAGSATGARRRAKRHIPGLLESLGARRFVVGHTVLNDGGTIVSRFGGAVFLIDTGMLRDYASEGRPSALEIVGDRVAAIYETGRVSLNVPPQSMGHGDSPPPPFAWSPRGAGTGRRLTGGSSGAGRTARGCPFEAGRRSRRFCARRRP